MYRGSQKNASKKCKLPHRHAKLPAAANEFKQVCRRDTLFGSKLAVQGYLEELKQLKAAEADKVFEAIRSRIIGADTFDTLPEGIHGLRVLVQAQPLLQGRLIDFLESLPKARCGVWVVSGWQGVVVDATCITRFDALLGEWCKAPSSAELKTAARQVQKQPKGNY